jgi:enoyl-[acyl-carrier protein] reductase III
VLDVLGRVDIFVSNAASGLLRPTSELTSEQLQHCFDINVRPLQRIVRRLVTNDGSAAMTKGGRIIALSSSGARRAIPLYTAVGASKAALEAMIRHMALELGGRGITANVVSPGIVDTKALRAFPHRQELLDEALRRTPAGRLVTPDDVAAAVAFLCSDEASMINGQTLTVDGGYDIVG